jgi:hypothetical protein
MKFEVSFTLVNLCITRSLIISNVKMLGAHQHNTPTEPTKIDRFSINTLQNKTQADKVTS